MLDQPWNALRLVEAGVAADPIPFHKMTAKVRNKGAGGTESKGKDGAARGGNMLVESCMHC